jgi:Carboxypeptidase regulatory-like domain
MLVRFVSLCVPLLIVSSALPAQETSSTQTAKVPAKETCSIAGVVVKSETNEPLGKAHVFLYKWDNPGSGYSTQTDGSGHFAIQKVEPGRYRLQVQRTGYLSQFYQEDPSARRGAVLALNPGNNIPDLLFRMAPSATIAGRITDEDGEP